LHGIPSSIYIVIHDCARLSVVTKFEKAENDIGQHVVAEA